MKHLFKSFLLVIISLTLLFFVACSSDDSPEPTKEELIKEEPEIEDEPEEEPDEEATAEESNQIFDNIVIKGGAKVEGVPPVPNEAITHILVDNPGHPVVEEGFDLEVFSESDITGAYIQFKAMGATVSESYYNVNLDANQADKSSKRLIKSNRESKFFGSALKSGGYNIDIDFGVGIEPGEFCYVICVYDAAGNISAPEEVCVTVNTWGGNTALIGAWNGIKYVDEENGQSEIDTIGEEFCGESSCNTEEYFTVIFNADGTYKTLNRYKNRDVNGTYDGDFDEDIARGKWSFPEETDSDLVLVEYYYSVEDANGIEEEISEAGESKFIDIYKSENVIFTSTELKLVYSTDDDGDGNPEYSTTIFFEKE